MQLNNNKYHASFRNFFSYSLWRRDHKRKIYPFHVANTVVCSLQSFTRFQESWQHFQKRKYSYLIYLANNSRIKILRFVAVSLEFCYIFTRCLTFDLNRSFKFLHKGNSFSGTGSASHSRKHSAVSGISPTMAVGHSQRLTKLEG